MKKSRCPKCNRPNVQVIIQDDIQFVRCPHCGFDESLYDVNPTQRNTQREKSKQPYKTGGHQRTRKG